MAIAPSCLLRGEMLLVDYEWLGFCQKNFSLRFLQVGPCRNMVLTWQGASINSLQAVQGSQVGLLPRAYVVSGLFDWLPGEHYRIGEKGKHAVFAEDKHILFSFFYFFYSFAESLFSNMLKMKTKKQIVLVTVNI